MTKQRLIWADSLKGWLMILVIIGHAIQCILEEGCNGNHVWNLIYSFHMPAFMAVSGWLAYRGDSKPIMADWGGYFSLCKRRGLQLLVPYFVWSILQFALSGDYTLQNLFKMILYPDAYFWFLWVLFWICVLFNLAQHVARRIKLHEMVSVGGLCVLLLGVMVVAEFRMFGFQFIAYYFLFYTLGYCLHKYEATSLIQALRSRYALIILTALWAFLAWGWTMHGLPSWMPAIPHVPTSLLQYAYRGFTALLAIIVLIGVAPLLLNGKGKINKFVSGVGVVSLGMYTGHLFLLGHIQNLLMICYPEADIWVATFGISIVGFILSYLLVRILEKNSLSSMVMLGKINNK